MVTIPNMLTLLRACAIPLFLWLLLSREANGLAFLVLALGAVTDYLDGKIARALNQTSALGAALDPAIDRLYIAATIVGLAIREIIPWWLVFLLLARDIFMIPMLALYRSRTGRLFEVTYLGKAATFNLLYAFPLLLLSKVGVIGEIAHILGWAFAIWGSSLYLWTAVQYSSQALTRPLN